MPELKNTLILALLIIALLYFAAKRYSEFFERCLSKGRSYSYCSELLR